MFTRILPSPFRKRIRKRQRKGFRHITEKQNFVHKEMSSKSFLRQQRQQWQREERAQRKMSRSDIQQGQQDYCCQLVFSQAQGTISSTCQLNKKQLLNSSTIRKRSTWIIWERLLPKLCVCLSRLRKYPCVFNNKNIPAFGLFRFAVTFYRFCHHIIFFFRHLIGFYPPVIKV